MSGVLERLRAGVATGSAAETQELGAALAEALPADMVLALHGDLGAGKTTFVQGLAAGFGIAGPVTSPTFGLFRLYPGKPRRPGSRMLAHLDAYRLSSAAEAEALLLHEYLVSPWCLAVEWPENVGSWLPRAAWHLELGIGAKGLHTLRLR
jgi:tRNA threonylcarbamoyladenosine biosynthesis protein TsaE